MRVRSPHSCEDEKRPPARARSRKSDVKLVGWTDGRVRGRSKRGAAKVCLPSPPAPPAPVPSSDVAFRLLSDDPAHFISENGTLARSPRLTVCLSVWWKYCRPNRDRVLVSLSVLFSVPHKKFWSHSFPGRDGGRNHWSVRQNSRVCTRRGMASSEATSAEEIRPNITITLRGDFSLLSHKVELGGGGKAWHARASSSF